MKTALITGTSSGIGEAAANYFLQQGWRVCATARVPETLGPWSRRSEVIPLALDVTRQDSVDSAIAEAMCIAGKIDVLVNNAGVGLAGPLEAIPTDDIEQHFQTNVFGTVRMIQRILPFFRTQNHGVIVNISSVVGTFGVPYTSPYCAGKFAVEGLSESLYYELLPFNIRVKLVEPGGIKTRFRQIAAQHDAYHPDLLSVETRVKQYEQPDSSLPAPRNVAKTIFKAATDGTQRLRYPVESESLWRLAIARSFGIGRKPSSSNSGID
jgi:NAD(P)-dependent dehydrogenase (short-subunit alcohol dehydrogenase family)